MFDIALIQLYDNQFNNKDMDVPSGLDCSAVYAVLQLSKQRSKFTSCLCGLEVEVQLLNTQVL